MCSLVSSNQCIAAFVIMASDDDEGEVFGQRHPPLSIYIKGILERYPDGQIFKVYYK